MRTVKDLVQSIYDRHPCGCCLHVVLDDQNYETEFITKPDKCEHDDCRELALILLAIPFEARAVALGDTCSTCVEAIELLSYLAHSWDCWESSTSDEATDVIHDAASQLRRECAKAGLRL